MMLGTTYEKKNCTPCRVINTHDRSEESTATVFSVIQESSQIMDEASFETWVTPRTFEYSASSQFMGVKLLLVN